MSDEEAKFESATEFVDDPAEQPELTPEQEYDKSFEDALEPPKEGEPDTAKEEVQAKRYYETLSDDEFKSVFEKARRFDELNERLKKTNNDAFGRIGGLENAIKEMRASAPQAVEINSAALKNLAEYFGDDSDGLVDALAKDLSALQLGIPMAPDFDIDARLASESEKIYGKQAEHEQKLQDMKRELDLKILTLQHPNWEELNTVPEKTKEFIGWQQTLKAEDRKALDEASFNYDVRALSVALTKFNAWKAKKDEFEQTKNQRLQDNLVPTKGNGATRPQPNFGSDYEREFQKALTGR